MRLTYSKGLQDFSAPLRFRTLVSNINGAVYRCRNDAHWTMDFISDGILDLSGYPATDFIGNHVRSYASIMHAGDTESVETIFAQALANQVSFTLEYRILHADGTIRWIYEKGKGIFDADGQCLFIEGVFFDITDAKNKEAERIQYQEKLQFLIQKMPLGVIEWNTQFQVVSWNPAAEEIFGYSAAEMLGQHAKLIVPPEFQPYVDDLMLALVEERGGNYSVNQNVTQAGQTITCEWINTVLYDTRNQVLGIYSVVQDITHRIQAEADLRQREANLRAQASTLNELSRNPAISQGQTDVAFREITERVAHSLGVDRASIWLFDPSGAEVRCQSLFELKTRRHSSGQTMQIADYPAYFTALHQESICSVTNAHTDPRTREFADTYLTPLGITSVLDLTLGQDGQITGIFCLEALDEPRQWKAAEENFARSVANLVTLVLEAHQRQQKKQELKQTLNQLQSTQTQLVQSEKMSSVGQLVAGVAHEINNPVSFIYGNLTHATQYVSDLLGLIDCYQTHYPDPHPEIVAEINKIDLAFVQEDLSKLLKSMNVGTERIRNIVQSLRNFSRLDEAEVKGVDLHEGIDSTLLILKTRLRAQDWRPEIQVIKDYGDLPLHQCYAGQLNQVFMNLLSNAIDALEDIWKVSISTHFEKRLPKY
ncbi:MAG: PAS domain S-box protein [Leptolyngbyaceae cyanobacterium]